MKILVMDEDYGENAEKYDEDLPEGRATSERVNRLTGNLARRGPVTRAMFSAYSPNYFKFNRRRIRIGNVR
ncbi:MAG: hypothetical protein WBL44_04960 [Nitrososphaeraceae archaeon]|jgi:hypothetical protein